MGQIAADNTTFADRAAEAQLRAWVPLLRDAERHEGRELVRVKRNASRTVWRCQLDGQAYYLKHYRPAGGLERLVERVFGDDAQRELRFAAMLNARGVRAAPVLAAGRGPAGAWMLSRAVEPAEPLDAWHRARADSNEPLCAREVRRANHALAELVGRMHLAGVLHHDLHTGNVLMQAGPDGNPILTLMDLHRMSAHRRLSRRARARNLAQLLHDRGHLTTRTERLAFLKRYLRTTGGPGTLRGWRLLVERFAGEHTRRLHAARDRRVRGRNKYFTRIRAAGGWAGHAILASKRRLGPTRAAETVFQPQDWQLALSEPAALLRPEDAAIVKDSPSGLVLRRPLRVGAGTVEVYVKYYRRKRRHKALIDLFRPSRALRAFRLGHALLTRQIPTALPLAAMERRLGPHLRESLLITEAVTPAEPLNRFFDRWLSPTAVARGEIDPRTQRWLEREVLRRLGRLLMRLHQAGFAHRDLKSSNLLVWWQRGEPPEIVLIDLDGLSVHGRVSQRRMVQGLMRLNVSLLECPSVTHSGRLRMLMGYLRRPGSGRVEFKPLWRVIEQWSARKLRRQLSQRRRRQRRQRLEVARA